MCLCTPLRVGITQRRKSVGAGPRGGRRKLFVLRMYQGMGLGAWAYALGLILWGYCLQTRSGGGWGGGGEHMSAIINVFPFLSVAWGIPPGEQSDVSCKRLGSENDNIGGVTLSLAFYCCRMSSP